MNLSSMTNVEIFDKMREVFAPSMAKIETVREHSRAVSLNPSAYPRCIRCKVSCINCECPEGVTL